MKILISLIIFDQLPEHKCIFIFLRIIYVCKVKASHLKKMINENKWRIKLMKLWTWRCFLKICFSDTLWPCTMLKTALCKAVYDEKWRESLNSIKKPKCEKGVTVEISGHRSTHEHNSVNTLLDYNIWQHLISLFYTFL